MKEVELFPAIQNMYSKQEVFAEVPVRMRRPDVVIRNGEEITIIEMKTSLNAQLIEQVIHWRYSGICDYVYVAVPEPKKRPNHKALETLCALGIGVIYVSEEIAYSYQEPIHLFNNCKSIWDKVLLDAYKHEIGGSVAQEGMLTLYRHMINQIKRFMVKNPEPISAQELVKKVPEIGNHYRNPVPSIRSALSDFESDWCNKTIKKGKVYFSSTIKRIPIRERES